MQFRKTKAQRFNNLEALSLVPVGQVATVGHWDAQLSTTLARVTEQRVGDFHMQELANTAWSFAKADQRDAQLFATLARAA